MGLQAQFNQAVIDMLPAIKEAINNAGHFGSNQMICSTIRAACDSVRPLDCMNDEQLRIFEQDLLDYFVHMNWTKKGDQ